MPNVAEVSVDIEFTDGLHLPKHGIDHYVSSGSADSRAKKMRKRFSMNTKSFVLQSIDTIDELGTRPHPPAMDNNWSVSVSR